MDGDNVRIAGATLQDDQINSQCAVLQAANLRPCTASRFMTISLYKECDEPARLRIEKSFAIPVPVFHPG